MATSSTIKPLKLWGQRGPNPYKVGMLLKEFALPYDVINVPITDVKNPSYTAINPNGRLPALHDPNTDITIWESGAIVEYLIEVYDSEHHRLSFKQGTPESWHAKQWLHFQTSGQGPYYGQAYWFQKFHSEQLPSAIERYNKELNRVTRVLEDHLKQQKQLYAEKAPGSDGPWLVGNKLSYADIAFVPWQVHVGKYMEKDAYDVDHFPLVKEWLGKMTSRKAIKDILADVMEAASKKAN
ncbi:MAG: hypothetical protein L6R37_005754 [Teloschistes peruensis]|nr:MAG: hypothetical protein L6R37_005754 [Teloschistes peruensis]